MSYWNTLRIGASALSAQRLRLDIISNNLANSETTNTGNGSPYQRQDVVFQADGQPVTFPAILQRSSSLVKSSSSSRGVRVSQIVTDQTEGTKVLDPNHPDADEDGYVQYPNVNLVVEMTNMLSASRSYEANLTLISASKAMAQKALQIGR